MTWLIRLRELFWHFASSLSLTCIKVRQDKTSPRLKEKPRRGACSHRSFRLYEVGHRSCVRNYRLTFHPLNCGHHRGRVSKVGCVALSAPELALPSLKSIAHRARHWSVVAREKLAAAQQRRKPRIVPLCQADNGIGLSSLGRVLVACRSISTGEVRLHQ